MNRLPQSSDARTLARWARRAAALCTSAVAVVLLVAGVGKLADMGGFSDSLRSWSLLPRWAGLVAHVVPYAEIGLSLAWLLGVQRRAAGFAMAWLVVGFTVLYTAHVIRARPPNCECFGLWDRYFSDQSRARMVILRNAMLLALLAAGALLSRWGRSASRVIGDGTWARCEPFR